MSTILLVEDNPHIMKINAEALSMYGYEILQAATARECRQALRWHPVDLVVLDIMLPDGDGVKLCRELKEQYHTPILFLSALGESRDVVEGLRAGGDDYLSKPYDLEVLAARIEARLRQERAKSRYISYGSLRLDIFAGCAYLGSANLQLTQKEFAVLLLLVRNAGRTVSKQEVLMEAWNNRGRRQSGPLDTDLPAAPEAQQPGVPDRDLLQAGRRLYAGADLTPGRPASHFCGSCRRRIRGLPVRTAKKASGRFLKRKRPLFFRCFSRRGLAGGAYPFFRRVRMFCPSRYSYWMSSISRFAIRMPRPPICRRSASSVTSGSGRSRGLKGRPRSAKPTTIRKGSPPASQRMLASPASGW